MQQQRGFTLIELIIVIVILGILAVTAAPRFIDIQSDATESTLQGVKAALQGGAQLVYAKAAIAGKQNNEQGTAGADAEDTQVKIGNNTVEIDFGYPDADSTTTMADLADWVDISASDFTFTAGEGSATAASPALGFFGIALANTAVDYGELAETGLSCHVVYQKASSTTSPVVTVVSGNC